MQDQRPAFVAVTEAAELLGIPLAWMKREAEAGRIPAVRAGRRWLVHLERTQAILAERAVSRTEASNG
ncbi:MAG: helix-turn-helix domain-containing protein [Phycisphaerales bacterium]